MTETVIAVRPLAGAVLLDLGDGMGAIEQDGVRGDAHPIEAILARGYWEPATAELAEAWAEELHPRHPAGTKEGGRFRAAAFASITTACEAPSSGTARPTSYERYYPETGTYSSPALETFLSQNQDILEGVYYDDDMQVDEAILAEELGDKPLPGDVPLNLGGRLARNMWTGMETFAYGDETPFETRDESGNPDMAYPLLGIGSHDTVTREQLEALEPHRIELPAGIDPAHPVALIADPAQREALARYLAENEGYQARRAEWEDLWRRSDAAWEEAVDEWADEDRQAEARKKAEYMEIEVPGRTDVTEANPARDRLEQHWSDGPDRVQQKIDLQDEIGDALYDQGLFDDRRAARDWANERIGAWSDTSNKTAVASELQLVAAGLAEVDLPDYQLHWAGINGVRIDPKGMEFRRNEAFLRETYKNTQRWLDAIGVGPDDQVLLYRGGHRPDDAPPGTSIWLSEEGLNNVLSSWTWDRQTADSFGSETFAMLVPRRRIISGARTGLGCLPENELIVLGGNDSDEAKVIGR